MSARLLHPLALFAFLTIFHTETAAVESPSGSPSGSTAEIGTGTFISGTVIDVLERPTFLPANWGALAAGGEGRRIISVGDVNGDGRADLIFAYPSPSLLRLKLSNGKNGFTDAESSLSSGMGEPIGAGDLDGDGCSDIFLWKSDSQQLTIGKSDCKEHFVWSAPIRLRNVRDPVSAVVQDVIQSVAKDGDRQLLLSGLMPERNYILKGDKAEPDERLRPDFNLDLLETRTDSSPTSVLADIDGDGRKDLLSPRVDTQHRVWFVTGTGKSSVPHVELYELYPYPVLVPMDVNGDGREDLLVHPSRKPSLLGWRAVLSAKDGGIEIPITRPVPDFLDLRQIRTGDFNGDGFADLVGIRQGGATTGEDEIWVSIRVPPKGIAGATIRSVDESITSVTDDSGAFTLSLSPHTSTEFTFQKPGFVFRPSSFHVDADAQPKSKLLVAGEQITGPGSALGRMIGIIGDPPGPYICLGYHPIGYAENVSFSREYLRTSTMNWAMGSFNCPPGYAMLNVNTIRRGLDGEVNNTQLGNCCRLPDPKILRDEHHIVADRCPPNSIITGFRPASYTENHRHLLRCTAIETDRYRLGAEEPGTYWGYAYSMRFERNRIPRSRLPAPLRAGAGRTTLRTRTDSGCTGGTAGGLFVSLDGETCRAHRFRTLQYAGRAGDPPLGTPVPMFPNCSLIEDPNDPLTGCR